VRSARRWPNMERANPSHSAVAAESVRQASGPSSLALLRISPRGSHRKYGSSSTLAPSASLFAGRSPEKWQHSRHALGNLGCDLTQPRSSRRGRARNGRRQRHRDEPPSAERRRKEIRGQMQRQRRGGGKSVRLAAKPGWIRMRFGGWHVVIRVRHEKPTGAACEQLL